MHLHNKKEERSVLCSRAHAAHSANYSGFGALLKESVGGQERGKGTVQGFWVGNMVTGGGYNGLWEREGGASMVVVEWLKRY